MIISQRRLDYYQENTMWTPVASNDLNQLSFQIAGAAFTFGGSIAFALENQLHLLSRTYSSPSMSKLKDLRSNVTDLNSTLPNYHPQLLVQCLLSGEYPASPFYVHFHSDLDCFRFPQASTSSSTGFSGACTCLCERQGTMPWPVASRAFPWKSSCRTGLTIR